MLFRMFYKNNVKNRLKKANKFFDKSNANSGNLVVFKIRILIILC